MKDSRDLARVLDGAGGANATVLLVSAEPRMVWINSPRLLEMMI
jgi:hypothetical protein